MGHKGRVEIKKKEKNSETKSWFLKKGKVDNLAVYIRNKKKRHKLSISGIKKVIYYRILKIYIDNKESSRIIRIKVKFNKDKSKILQHFSNKSIKQFTWKKKQEL